MGVETGIEYVHHTWNSWRGCAKISRGCQFCFADALSHRNPAVLGVWGPNGTRVIAKDWSKPLAWDRAAAKAGERRRIFMSMNDWLEDRPELDEPRARLFKLIDETPNLDWLLLTKRPENFKPLMRRILDAGLLRVSPTKRGVTHWDAVDWLHGKPPRNVWLGVSVEDQEAANRRLDALAQIPAEVHWVSYEPALGPVDFDRWLSANILDWIVVGGESGKDARPFDLQWARDTIRQCRWAGVPVFVKQLGRRPWYYAADAAPSLVVSDSKGGIMAEWPCDLRVREMPEGARP